MKDKRTLVIHDVIDALEEMCEVIKIDIAKYAIHSITKEKVEEYFVILRQIKTIFDKICIFFQKFVSFSSNFVILSLNLLSKIYQI